MVTSITEEELTEGLPQSDLLRLRLIVQNNRLKTEMEAKGYTMGVLAEKASISASRLSTIINLRRLPSEEQQISIAIALCKPIEYLFPDALLNAVKRKTLQNRTRLVSEEKLKKLVGPPLLMITDGGLDRVEEEVDTALLHGKIEKVFSTLEPREVKVLEMRFGLIDGRPRSLDEVGWEFHVTRERIRQIECKALRKLRHPWRARMLVEKSPPEVPKRKQWKKTEYKPPPRCKVIRRDGKVLFIERY